MGRDGWIGLGLLLLSGWFYSNLGKIPPNPFVPLGPAFYPRLLLILTIILSLALVLQDLLGHGKGKIKATLAFKSWFKNCKLTLFTFFIFGLYVLLLPMLGYLLSTILFVTVLQWLLGPPLLWRVPGSLLVGFGTSLITYMAFEKYLHVFLPRGTWLP